MIVAEFGQVSQYRIPLPCRCESVAAKLVAKNNSQNMVIATKTIAVTHKTKDQLTSKHTRAVLALHQRPMLPDL